MKIPWEILIVLSIALLGRPAVADELKIIDVRRNITLSDDETPYKDFYINGGENDGLKKNLVVTATRKISVRDASGSQTYGEIQAPVGQLRIISTQGKVSVAREYKLLPREELPMLEQIGIMTGDKIDLNGSFVDSKPASPAKKKTTAAHKQKTTDITTIVAVKTTTTAGRAPASVAPAVTTPNATGKPEKTADSSTTKAATAH